MPGGYDHVRGSDGSSSDFVSQEVGLRPKKAYMNAQCCSATFAVGVIVVAVAMGRSTAPYNSVVASTFGYFGGRLHSSIPDAPILGDAAWKGAELARNTSLWRSQLSPAEAAELVAAVQHAEAAGVPTREMKKNDFPLPTLAARLREWTAVVGDGSPSARGFHVVRGVPVDGLRADQLERLFWGWGLHMGTPGAQNNAGDLLGHVRNVDGVDAARARQYKTKLKILPHCDGTDIVALLCVRGPKSGGASRLVSSVSIFNTLLEERPDVLPRLFSIHALDVRGSGGVNWFPLEPLRHHAGVLKTFYHTEYFRTSYNHDDAPAPAIPEEDEAALAVYDEVASRPGMYLDMDFQVGDVQMVSNHVVLHSREAYEDGEGEDRRHLLRLWLNVDSSPYDAGGGTVDRLVTLWLKATSHAKVALRLVWAKVRGRVWGGADAGVEQ